MKVLITRQIPDAGIRLLKEHSELELDYRQSSPLSKEELKEAIKYVDAIIPVITDKINESSLIRALSEKRISGAGLDVFEQEPKISQELRDLENVVLTPHVASATREARIQMATMAAKNVIEVLVNNKEPINQIKMRAVK